MMTPHSYHLGTSQDVMHGLFHHTEITVIAIQWVDLNMGIVTRKPGYKAFFN